MFGDIYLSTITRFSANTVKQIIKWHNFWVVTYKNKQHMDTWIIIFYVVLAATIVSYAILMNYKKDRNEFMDTREQDDPKKTS